MATSVKLIRKYVWLIDTIRRSRRLTFQEIKQKWQNDGVGRLLDEAELIERTFHRHRDAIAEIFGIEILCNRYDNTYYIANEEVLNQPSFTSWLFNGLAIENQIIDNKEISQRIVFEEAPGGMEHMPLVIQALSERRKLQLSYDSISHGEFQAATILPYFIKERLRRWYIIARIEETGEIGIFAFDRITDPVILNDTFEFPADINPATYFDEVVGILLDDEYDCERIVLRMHGRQAKYVELLPLHKSQREIGRGRNYTDFEFHLRPEWEFVHEILRLGYEAEILSPQWLREEIKWQAEEIARRYESK